MLLYVRVFYYLAMRPIVLYIIVQIWPCKRFIVKQAFEKAWRQEKSMMQKILIVEDDADISHLLGRILKGDGYQTVSAFSGTEARLVLGVETFDLLILDLMLPGMSGEELVTYIRKELCLPVPILVISARAALKNKVELLKGGADDYLTKPFEPEEVLARVLALLRRSGQTDVCHERAENVYTFKRLALYPDARKALVNQKELSLTVHEFDILKLLVRFPDKVFSREALYEQVWNGGYYGEDHTVNVHVSNLRRKIAAADPKEEYIKTVWGIGFKMA